MSSTDVKHRIQALIDELVVLMYANGYGMDYMKVKNKYGRWENVTLEALPSKLGHIPTAELSEIETYLARAIGSIRKGTLYT
jgi:hypothetical protein